MAALTLFSQAKMCFISKRIWGKEALKNIYNLLANYSMQQILINQLQLSLSANEQRFHLYVRAVQFVQKGHELPYSRKQFELRAQLFEGGLALTPGLNLILIYFSCIQKHFLEQFFLLFLELPIINWQTKRIKTEMLFKISNLNSNLALTLDYLNPALNNSAQFDYTRENYLENNEKTVLLHKDFEIPTLHGIFFEIQNFMFLSNLKLYTGHFAQNLVLLSEL